MISELTQDTTVLELVEFHPETEVIFDQYTKKIGICICCEALFCTLNEVSRRYEIDIDELLNRLNSVMQ
jgi:hypothetical protein